MLRIVGLVVIAWTAVLPAAAQDYPSRPVRIVFPLAAGGGGDVFTRALAEELQKAWHQPVVVENRPGGGQNIGARACVEATPDGYTLCLMSSEPAVYNQYLFKSIPYDPEKDLQPIANLFFNTLAVVINSDHKVNNLAGMIAMAKQQPGKLSYSTFSFPATVFMDKLNKAEHTDIVKVPYKGGGEVVNAVLGGTTPIAVLALSNMVPLLQSGRITPLAVVAPSRSPLFPDVPTLEQARPGWGFPTTWFGLFAPTGVPRAIVEKVAAEVDRIIADPAFSKRMFIERGVEPASERLDVFAKFVRDERKFAQEIVEESGLEPK
ncbi:MAG: tripartite tricarboxylate transporter substrate binding protein [Alphaproteobacteria bacterium]|nr:tripartite tricarboxylate transporter substrate binding protein [Alphaproteobacteria bacterium]